MSAVVGKDSARGDQRSFHGMIVPRAWINCFFWDRVDIDGDRILLRPWLRRRRVVNRDSVDAIGFEPVMFFPFVWKWNYRFLRDGRDVLPLLFTAVFKQRFRRALEDLGWPVVDLPPHVGAEFPAGPVGRATCR